MTDRLNTGSAKQPKRTPQEWCDHGNAYLRGELANAKGEYITTPRHDVHWFVQDGKATIGWKRSA